MGPTIHQPSQPADLTALVLEQLRKQGEELAKLREHNEDLVRQMWLPFSEIQKKEADRAKRLAMHAVRPISEHVADWEAVLKHSAKPNHIKQTVNRVRVLLSLAGVEQWAQLTGDKITDALVKVVASPHRKRKTTLGPATINHYLNSMRAFCSWMASEDQGRAERSPVRKIKLAKVERDTRVKRRPLPKDDRDQLLIAAFNGPVIAGIPGYERAITYELAWTTGLRKSELASLTRRSFHLDGDTPYVTCEAAYTKNAHQANQPLNSTIAQKLSLYLARVKRDDNLFRFPANGTYALQKDLARAGIPYHLHGERSDNHSQRHAYVTDLMDLGLGLHEVQKLARHQDARTTQKYAHPRPEAQRLAIERLHVGMSGMDCARAISKAAPDGLN